MRRPALFHIIFLATEPIANFYLGVMHHEGDGVTKDTKKAFHFYTIAAEAGDRPTYL